MEQEKDIQLPNVEVKAAGDGIADLFKQLITEKLLEYRKQNE